jgi:hypothetical protein
MFSKLSRRNIHLTLFGLGSLTLAATPVTASTPLISSSDTAVRWTYPLPLATGTQYASHEVTKAVTVDAVRALANQLGPYVTPMGAFPTYAVLPQTFTFYPIGQPNVASRERLVVYLNGCPFAMLYRHHGASVEKLGSRSIVQITHGMEHLIIPLGQPLA